MRDRMAAKKKRAAEALAQNDAVEEHAVGDLADLDEIPEDEEMAEAGATEADERTVDEGDVEVRGQ